MCQFCETLLKGKEIKWLERSHYGDDNFCETVCNYCDCDNCGGCAEFGFKLVPYRVSGYLDVAVEYYRSGYGTTIHPLSGAIPLNFCPFCGNQLNEVVDNFNEFKHHFKL